MADGMIALEQRVAVLEQSIQRWRRSTLLLGTVAIATALTAFRAPRQSVIEGERIILRGRMVSNGSRAVAAPRVELSVGILGALSAQFSNDTAARGTVSISPSELRLADEHGRETGRLGSPAFRPLVK